MNKLYILKLDENEVVLESTFGDEVIAPTVEEFKEDYNAAYDIVSEDENVTEPKEEFAEVIKILLATKKYRQPQYQAIVIMEGEMDIADTINGNVITSSDEETAGFTMEQLDNLADKF